MLLPSRCMLRTVPLPSDASTGGWLPERSLMPRCDRRVVAEALRLDAREESASDLQVVEQHGRERGEVLDALTLRLISRTEPRRR